MKTLRQLQLERAKFRRGSFSYRYLRIGGLIKGEIMQIPMTVKYGLKRYLKEHVDKFLKGKKIKFKQKKLIDF